MFWQVFHEVLEFLLMFLLIVYFLYILILQLLNELVLLYDLLCESIIIRLVKLNVGVHFIKDVLKSFGFLVDYYLWCTVFYLHVEAFWIHELAVVVLVATVFILLWGLVHMRLRISFQVWDHRIFVFTVIFHIFRLFDVDILDIVILLG